MTAWMKRLPDWVKIVVVLTSLVSGTAAIVAGQFPAEQVAANTRKIEEVNAKLDMIVCLLLLPESASPLGCTRLSSTYNGSPGG